MQKSAAEVPCLQCPLVLKKQPDTLAVPAVPFYPNSRDADDTSQMNKWLDGVAERLKGEPASTVAASQVQQLNQYITVSQASQLPQLQAIEALLELHHSKLEKFVDSRLSALRGELLCTSVVVRKVPQSTTCGSESGESNTDAASLGALDTVSNNTSAPELDRPCSNSTKPLLPTGLPRTPPGSPRKLQSDSKEQQPNECASDSLDLEDVGKHHLTSVQHADKVLGTDTDFAKKAITAKKASHCSVLRQRLSSYIHCQRFDMVMGALISLNVVLMFLEFEKKGHAASILLRLEHESGIWTNTDGFFEVAQHCFNVIFFMELVLRFAADGCSILRSAGTLLDAFIVLTSVIDYLLKWVFDLGGANMNFLRMLRMLRLLKVLKVFRAAAVFSELRIIIKALIDSVMALVWSTLVLFSIMLFFGMVMAQLVAGVVNNEHANYELRKWTFQHYGTASRAFYTLFEATLSGGWPNYARRLIEDVSVWFVIFWIFYVLFVVFAVMRVITAIFLQKTMKVTGTEEELMMMGKMNEKDEHIAKLKVFLAESDTNGNCEMTSDELHSMLQHPDIEHWLDIIGLESHEIEGLFCVLDDGDGIVSHNELVNGIMRLSGGVRVIDTVMIMHNQKMIVKKLDQVDAQVSGIRYVASTPKNMPDMDPYSHDRPLFRRTPAAPCIA